MKKTVTTNIALNAYRLLNGISAAKLSVEDTTLLVRILRPLKRIASDWDGFVKDAGDKVRPEDFEELQKNATECEGKLIADLTDDQREKLDRYTALNRAFSTALEAEGAKEVEVDLPDVDDTGVCRLAAGANLVGGDVVMLIETLTA